MSLLLYICNMSVAWLYKPWSSKGYSLFEIIINILVISFRSILIRMLLVYDHYKCLLFHNLTTIDVISDVNRRHIPTSYIVGPRAERVKATPLLTFQSLNYSIWIFTHLKLCLADAIHNFKWVKIIQIWQNGRQLFSNIADWCHILFLTCLKGGT